MNSAAYALLYSLPFVAILALGILNLRGKGDDTPRPGRALLYVLPFVGAVGLIFTLYWTTFSWWWHEWTWPGSFYAHALFVPFFVGVMIWRNRERLALAAWRPAWSGLSLLVPAMALLLLAQKSDVTTVKSVSFVLLLLGGAMLMLGPPKTRVLLFPLLFVVMMMPLIPDQLINWVAFPIQIASAQIATKLLNLLTLHAVCEGTRIVMDPYKMDVELPCSGFKTLISLLTFSAAFAYLVEAALWKRWLLFLTTVPLSLIINALRITFIGIVGELVSTKAAATFHDYSGFIVLILAFFFLFNFASVLKCERFLGIPLNDDEAKREAASGEAAAGAGEPPWWKVILMWRPTLSQLRRVQPYILGFDLVLATTLGVQGYVLKTAVPHNPIATFQVPTKLTDGGITWTASADAELKEMDKLPKAIQDELSPSRVINRNYTGSDGSQIQFFMTAGNGRKVFHDPHTCSLGSDAILSDVGTMDIATKYGTIRVLESHFKRHGMADDFEMMFCYVVEGNVVQRTEQVRNKMILQMLIGDSGMPSYFFRVFQNVPGTEPVKREQVKQFIAAMWNEIGPILKGSKPGAYEAPPTPALHVNEDK